MAVKRQTSLLLGSIDITEDVLWIVDPVMLLVSGIIVARQRPGVFNKLKPLEGFFYLRLQRHHNRTLHDQIGAPAICGKFMALSR